eukprot:CAMPEP_0115831914 /NCGR_PEP_ID=MMETSP0287-20121206/2383_1 /TAXON_ID=412157 /ORGANISM="Chrysochromulina rotalis, Strain UIO044" /LENGTH=40 /DNA_ID= /DNA_START= /DNA_END= /DNA_ORIENTATION=
MPEAVPLPSAQDKSKRGKRGRQGVLRQGGSGNVQAHWFTE